MCFRRSAIVALSFRNPFSDKSAQTFSSNKIYDVLILPRGYQADDMRMSLTSIFFRIRFGYVPFRLRIKFSAIRVYALTCACSDKAAQMYFGSMNYASRIYITSNYLVVIKPAFSFARTTCARQTFSRKG